MKKRLLSTLLALCAVLALLPGAALAAETSGSCGDNVTWSYSGGILTIQGTGPMEGYVEAGPGGLRIFGKPWEDYREQIHTVIIGDGVTSVGDGAFDFHNSLTSVSIPNSVTAVGDFAFDLCGSLSGITIPASVTSIGMQAFSACRGLTGVTIPNGVTAIGDYAFANCESLTSVNIPNGITAIGTGVFDGCRGLTGVTIPDSVTAIGEFAFNNCEGLTGVTIPAGVTTIGKSAFQGCRGLTGVNIPAGVTVIEEFAFNMCDGLTGVTIPNGVTAIGAHAFSSCGSLTGVTIPGSVASIGEGAFKLCPNLKDVYYGGSESQWTRISVDPTDDGNAPLLGAAIHYNGAVPGVPDTPASPTKFTDVAASSPFVEAINWAVEKNITTGKTDATFAPGEECTNGQILTFLWRASGSPEPAGENPFTDSIPASFRKAAVWAYEKGLVSGTVFGSSTPCTRAMTVEYLWKAAGSPAVSENAGFADVPAGADYARAVAWAVGQKVTSGTGDGSTFSPNNTCTRGQIVTFLYRAMGK